MKIDVFSHILPPKFRQALHQAMPSGFPGHKTMEALPSIRDVESRLQIIDKYAEYTQVLTIPGPLLTEGMVTLEQANELTRLANDELAELVARYPDNFAAGVATLPLTDTESTLREIDRALGSLGLKGILMPTPLDGKPLDSEQFLPIYEKMVQYDLPIWIHPSRHYTTADYESEDRSRYAIFSILGWPYDTTVAMVRLVLSGILEKYPALKFITHHCGGMVPFFAKRIEGSYDFDETRLNLKYKTKISKPLMDYFRLFYNDTALYGSSSALMCAYDFFGAEHILFGTDMPFDSEFGAKYIRETISSIEEMNIPDSDKKKIFEQNARKLLHLPA
jgi:predicted TIM-barrel fold metal-dependent hydrolase